MIFQWLHYIPYTVPTVLMIFCVFSVNLSLSPRFSTETDDLPHLKAEEARRKKFACRGRMNQWNSTKKR